MENNKDMASSGMRTLSLEERSAVSGGIWPIVAIAIGIIIAIIPSTIGKDSREQ